MNNMDNTNKKKKNSKRPAQQANIDRDSEEEDISSSDEDSEMMDEEEEEEANENVNVEFEAQAPIEEDFHGIKQLLGRLFLTQYVDLSELADLVIAQNTVGSTIKLGLEEDEEVQGEDEVLGVTSLLSIRKHKDKNCMKQLVKTVLSKCKEVAVDDCAKLENILESKNVGVLLNERFINIPPQFAVPMHKSLLAEVNEACAGDADFKFDYLLLLSKTLQATNQPSGGGENNTSGAATSKKKRKKSAATTQMKEGETEFTNVEDEVFYAASQMNFTYSVTEATGLAIGGRWDIGGQLMKPHRTVMLIPAGKWRNGIVDDIEQFIGT